MSETWSESCGNLAGMELVNFTKGHAKISASLPGVSLVAVWQSDIDAKAKGSCWPPGAQGWSQPAGPQKTHAVTALFVSQALARVCPNVAKTESTVPTAEVYDDALIVLVRQHLVCKANGWDTPLPAFPSPGSTGLCNKGDAATRVCSGDSTRRLGFFVSLFVLFFYKYTSGWLWKLGQWIKHYRADRKDGCLWCSGLSAQSTWSVWD